MTSSERPSPEPLLEKGASPAVLRGGRILECCGSLKCLELCIGLGPLGRLSSGIPGNAVRGFPGSSAIFLEFLPESPSRSGGMAHLSGSVLRDAARLSQRYPPLGARGLLVSQDPQNGYLSDACAIPYENKAKRVRYPLCDAISKGFRAIWGGYLALGAKATTPCHKTSQCRK